LYTFEINKIVGAILASILFIKVLGIAGEGLFEPQEQEKVAFPVKVEEAGAAAGGQKEEEKAVPLPVLLAQADPAKGEKVFRKCQACHTAAKDGKNMTGPWLWDVVGRKVATEAGYNYTDAMKNHGGEWTYDRLFEYLADPQKVVPGTKMSFAGLPKPTDRADVIDYLRQQNDNPPPLPPVPQEQAQPTTPESSSGATGEGAAAAPAQEAPAAAAPAAPAPATTGGEEKKAE
jgi:cytochrome c